MYISNEDKCLIIEELAQGNIYLVPETTTSLSGSDQDLDPQNYQNFDDFAQRPTWQRQNIVVQALFDQLKSKGLGASSLEE